MIIAFCGHSDYIENPEDEKKILDILQKEGVDAGNEFFLGEYGGFDTFSYKCAKGFKNTHPNNKLIFVTPYLIDGNRKKNMEFKRERFDLIIYPELENIPPRFAILYRNRWIVEQADIIIAYITHKYGGAYTMYRYAKQKNKKIYNIATFEID